MKLLGASEARLAASNKWQFQSGDVLYGKLRPNLDKAVMAQTEGVCSTDILVLRSRLGSSEPRFVLHLVHSAPFREFAVATAAGTKMPRTSASAIAKFSVKLPPLPEQRKIAAILSSIDETIEKTEAVIAQLQVVKKAMMQELLTRGMPGRHTRFKQTEIGEIPEGWKVGRVGDLLASGPTNGIYKPAADIGSGALLLGMTAIVGDTIDWSLSRRAVVTAGERERYRLRADDVLVRRVYARVEGVGRAVLVPDPPEDAVYESNMMRLRFDEHSVLPRFGCRAFSLRGVREQIEGAAQLAAQASVNNQALRAIQFPLPPLAEQAEIDVALDSLDTRSACEMAALRGMSSLKSALSAALLSGDLRVTPDPSEQPAQPA
ncbi:MAG: restriction endonuclease subunit S [Polyangiales bacterium]